MTPKDLTKKGIGLKSHKRGEAIEACVNFIFDKYGVHDVNLGDALPICDEIIDNQRHGERFSETLKMLVSENNHYAIKFMDYIEFGL